MENNFNLTYSKKFVKVHITVSETKNERIRIIIQKSRYQLENRNWGKCGILRSCTKMPTQISSDLRTISSSSSDRERLNFKFSADLLQLSKILNEQIILNMFFSSTLRISWRTYE